MGHHIRSRNGDGRRDLGSGRTGLCRTTSGRGRDEREGLRIERGRTMRAEAWSAVNFGEAGRGVHLICGGNGS